MIAPTVIQIAVNKKEIRTLTVAAAEGEEA